MNDLGLKAQVITEIAGPAYAEFAKTVGRCRKRHQHVVVASGGALQGTGRVRSTEAFNAALRQGQ